MTERPKSHTETIVPSHLDYDRTSVAVGRVIPGAIAEFARTPRDLKGMFGEYTLSPAMQSLLCDESDRLNATRRKHLGRWYRIGVNLSLDAMSSQGNVTGNTLPIVTDFDLQSYVPIRDAIMPRQWDELSYEELFDVAARLSRRLRIDDPHLYLLYNAFRAATSVFGEGESRLQKMFSFWSGIADVYYPIRYATELGF